MLPSVASAPSAEASRRSRLNSSRAFTLIELMAVVLVILLLAAIGLGVAGYVQRKAAVATAKSQIAAIEAALESYKSDWGYYPPTTTMRLSSTGYVELSNNATLYSALFKQGKQYLSFPLAQLHSELRPGLVVSNIFLFDVFGKPFNYYCSPRTTFALSYNVVGLVNISGTMRILTNYFTIGGQVNAASYDLFSYGPDQTTFAPPPAIFMTLSSSTVDDITNWGP